MSSVDKKVRKQTWPWTYPGGEARTYAVAPNAFCTISNLGERLAQTQDTHFLVAGAAVQGRCLHTILWGDSETAPFWQDGLGAGKRPVCPVWRMNCPPGSAERLL